MHPEVNIQECLAMCLKPTSLKDLNIFVIIQMLSLSTNGMTLLRKAFINTYQ
jgi:hypothetical protein